MIYKAHLHDSHFDIITKITDIINLLTEYNGINMQLV